MSMLSTLWTSVLESGHALRDDLSNLRELIDLRIEGLFAKPSLVGPLFGYLRNHAPILVVPGLAVVAKYADVCEILADSEHFAVVYAEKIEKTTGPYIVGMSDTPEYRYLKGLMHEAVHAGDGDTIRKWTGAWAEELITTAAPTGSIDVVAGLGRTVATRLVDHYFGVPAPEDSMRRWTRSIFRDIFVNLGNDPVMKSKAEASAEELKHHLDELIAQRTRDLAAGSPVPDDFLCRLLRIAVTRNIPAELVRRLVAGTIVGAVDNNSNSVAHVVDFLLDHQQEMDGARKAALTNDGGSLQQYIFEALRFNSPPILLRRCAKPFTVAAWTNRATLIPEQTLVVAGILSAMFDPQQFPDPDTFRADRPLDDYLFFGRGMHHCFGEYIAQVLIPETVKALLRRSGLRRRATAEGRIQYDGAFPNHLIIEFDPK
jgi:cytochrome P450